MPRAFYISQLAQLLFAFAITIVTPFVSIYMTDELGTSTSWVGTASMVVSLAAVSARLPGGIVSDRRGRRSVMLVGAAMGILGSGLYLLSSTVAIFLIARIFAGLAIGLFTTANKAFAADIAPPLRRGEAMGLNNGAFSVAVVISPLVGEGLRNEAGYAPVFLLAGLLALISLVIVFFLPDTKPDYASNARADIASTVGERGMWAALIMMLGLGSILSLMYAFFPLMADRTDFLADAPGLISAFAIGLGLSIWSAIDTVIEPIAGRISDRVGRQIVFVPGLFICLLGLMGLSRAQNTLSVYLSIAVMVTGWGIARAVADAISQDAVAPALRGMGAAVLYSGFDLAIGLDAQVLSLLISGSDFTIFFYAIAAMLLGFGILGLALATRLRTYDQRVSVLTSAD
jgi:MFS family permease